MTINKLNKTSNTQPYQPLRSVEGKPEAVSKLRMVAAAIFGPVPADINSLVRNSVTAISQSVTTVGRTAQVVYALGVSSLIGGVQTVINGTKWFVGSIQHAVDGYKEKNHKKVAEGATTATIAANMTALGAVTTTLGVDSVIGVSSSAGLVTAVSALGFVFYGLLAIYSIVKIIEKTHAYTHATNPAEKLAAHKELVRNIMLLLVSLVGITAFALSMAVAGPFGPILFAISAVPLWILLDSSPLFDKLANRLAPKLVEEKKEPEIDIKEKMRLLNQRRKNLRIKGSIPENRVNGRRLRAAFV